MNNNGTGLGKQEQRPDCGDQMSGHQRNDKSHEKEINSIIRRQNLTYHIIPALTHADDIANLDQIILSYRTLKFPI